MQNNQSQESTGAEQLESLVLSPTQEWYGRIVDLPIDLIKPDPENLRQEFNSDDIEDLGRNIQSIGQLDEITVFPIFIGSENWAGFFDLHDGERRWRAANAVGLLTLRAKIVVRPSDEDLLYKKVSRVLQTRSLTPETKVAGLEKALTDLGIMQVPESWESLREKLGGGPDWPQLVRVILLKPKVRTLMEDGLINFTIAQSLGRLSKDQQEPVAQFVVVNKINGRFFSTQMVPYLVEHPEASPAQAFEQARVGDWKQYSKSPYQKGEEPPLDRRVETFLDDCIKWERAWEVLVQTGLVHEIAGNSTYEYRVKDAARRISERAGALAAKISKKQTEEPKGQLNEFIDDISDRIT